VARDESAHIVSKLRVNEKKGVWVISREGVGEVSIRARGAPAGRPSDLQWHHGVRRLIKEKRKAKASSSEEKGLHRKGESCRSKISVSGRGLDKANGFLRWKGKKTERLTPL